MKDTVETKAVANEAVTPGLFLERYIGTKIINATPMTRKEYNSLRGWEKDPSETRDVDLNEDGYLVEYLDSDNKNCEGFNHYVSWSPAKEFEVAYRPATGLTFGMALEALKRGRRVARTGWNGKGMWLCVPLCGGPKEIPATGVWGKPNAEYAERNGGTVKVMPYVTMKTADGSIVMGWLASQTDMLSDDWEIVGTI